MCRASAKHWKTRPVKGLQKAPLFNEEIKLYVKEKFLCSCLLCRSLHRSVTEEEMNSEGSLVFFYLLDKRLRNRIPLGMCAIACKNIPHLSATAKSSIMDPLVPQRKNFRLQFFQFMSGMPSLTELIRRADFGDGMATNFLKTNQLLLINVPHLNIQPQSNAIGYMIRKTRSIVIR